MVDSSKKTPHSNSFSRHSGSLRRVPSRSSSIKNNIVELKSLELLDGLFRECRHVGEKMVSKGLITPKDIKEAKSSKGSRGLLRPAKANATRILIKQIRAEQLSPPKEDYLCKLVLLSRDSERLKNSSTAPAPVSEVKRAELDALARSYLSRKR
ncbi:hypothetical protein Ahy_A06g029863 [Arachis hypogaea]|uniref:Uncharacterized protein n=1 Tax=Arachis hypogaea TaxID=3818 RepID=A0A445CUG0_ARAHY|nr:hypothetical protein Ahy_A06g029863 [Arachis hypogaea]